MDIDPDVSAAIVTVLKECAGRALNVRALTTYVNGYTRAAADVACVQAHVDDLERGGYVRRTANRFNPALLEWSITESGKTL